MTKPHRKAIAALLGLATACLLCGPVHATTHAFLRRPDIHGDTVVFTSEGDLWIATISTGIVRRITSHPGVEIGAKFSPDGTEIAFSGQYDGGTDAYVMPTSGGEPKRLTYDPGGVRVIGWMPDGKSVIIRSRRFNPIQRDWLLTVPVAGGIPQPLAIPQAEHGAMNADGVRVAYVPVSAEWQNWYHYQGGQADDIWLADVVKKTFRRLTDYPGIDTTPVWVGDTIYFVSERDGLGNLYRMDAEGRRVTAVTKYADYDVRYPSTDGKCLVFEHGNGLAVYDSATGALKELNLDLASDRIHARSRLLPVIGAMNWVSLGPTGKRVLIESRGQVMSVPAESGDARIIYAKDGARAQFPVWSPDGKKVAFVSDKSGEAQIWTAPADKPGEAHQLTKDRKGPLGSLVWSPDGKWIAVGDHEARIMLVDASTGEITEVDQADRSGTYDSVNWSYQFSPDGKWLTFSRTEPNWFSAVYLYDIAGRKRIAVTQPETDSVSPVFDASGKYLLFLSSRQFDPRYTGPTRFFGFDKTMRVSMITLAADTPSPFLPTDDEEGVPVPPKKEPAKPDAPAPKLPTVKVDVDGLQSRVIDVPAPAGRYSGIDMIEGRILLVNTEDVPGQAQATQLQSFDIKKKQMTTLVPKLTGYEVSQDHKKILIRNGDDLSIVDAATGPVTAGAGKVDLAAASVEVDPVAEWRQIYHESWRIARDFFYDPNMHGVDWEGVKRKYEAELPAVNDRSDLNVILGKMIAELNCGHAYVGGGYTDERAAAVPMGFLGADLTPEPGANAYRVTKLFEGDGFDFSARSPLLDPGANVKVGDFILAVGGKPVRPDVDIQQLLVGTPGRVISLTVNAKPTMDGARVVRIKPMGSEGKSRYYDWVASRREYVRKALGDRVGYLHIPDMGDGGLQEFAKHYYPALEKDAIVYDVRNNGGGSISGELLLQMASHKVSYSKPRYGESWSRQNWGFNGYSVTLCNENSGSDAEWFSDMFQRLKLGPVIGKRTWGGLVGSGGGYRLIDGGSIFIPNYGAWMPDGKWVVEGPGFRPDVEVEQDPASLMAGKDPQLDRAIEYLREQLAKKPIVKPTPPPFPVKARRPRA